MQPQAKERLLAHLELQAPTLAAQTALAQLDDSKTDELLPEIRGQLVMIDETLRSLGAWLHPAAIRAPLDGWWQRRRRS